MRSLRSIAVNRYLWWIVAAGLVALALLGVPAVTSADDGAYVVQLGDDLQRVANRYGITLEDLRKANGLSDFAPIQSGQKLVIPSPSAAPPPVLGAAPTTAIGTAVQASALGAVQRPAGVAGAYRVVPGDTLSAIAARSGLTVRDLQAANSLGNSNLIRPGQLLNVPGGATVAPPAPRVAPAPNGPANPVGLGFTAGVVDVPPGAVFKLTHYCLYNYMASTRWVYPGAVAADPSIFPLGVRLLIDGLPGVYTVEDRFAWDSGTPRLDLWVPTCEEAILRGVQYRRAWRLPQ